MSIVNLGFGGKSKPKVGYATALDMYIILCMAAVFMALVEFACINFIDTFIKRFKKWEEEQKQLKENVKEEPTNGLVLKLTSENGKAVENEEIEEILITIENGQELPAQILRSDLHIPTFAESESMSTISRQDACVSTEDDDFEARENILHFGIRISIVTNSKIRPNTKYIWVLKMCRILNTEYIQFLKNYQI